jgi:alpha-mannosidase
VEDGPVRACIRVERRVSLHPALPTTEIVQDYILYRDLPYLVFQTRGNWQAERVLLKAEFDLAFACTCVACEMPYGVVERRPHRGQAGVRIGRDAAQEDGIRVGTVVDEPDRPMQKWLDFSDGERGVAFLNDGRYGYDASERQVRISLLRAPIHRDGETIGLGPFSFSYALLPHAGDWRAARLPQWGTAYNHELVPAFTAAHASPHAAPRAATALEGRSFYSVQDAHVLITAAKLAEDGCGVVLRLYQSSGQQTVTRLASEFELSHVTACDLLEDPLPDASGCRQVSPHAVEVTLEPFEIVTLLLKHGTDTG